MTLTLSDGQYDALNWMAHNPRGLLPLPVGYGKTAIALHFIDAKQASALVISTKYIIEHTWPDEIKKWGLSLSYASATGAKRKREGALESKPNILGVSFDNLMWYHTHSDPMRRKILVIDESSKMKSPSAKRVRAHLPRVQNFEYAYALSATPAPEGMMGLWSQFASITPERPLGGLTEFRTRYFDMKVRATHTEYTPKPDAVTRFSKAVRHLFYKPPSQAISELGLPEPREIEYVIDWSDQAGWDQYNDMANNLCIESGESYDIDRLVEAQSPGVLQNKLRQMASGFIYDNSGETVELLGYADKIEELSHFLDNVADCPVLVFTQFLEEQMQIQDRFPEAQIGLPDSLDDWNAARVPLMVLHPKSAGHGLNLQHGSNIVLFYSLPWSAEDYDQAIGRLNRRGQRQQVTVARFIRRGTIESRIYRVIMQKRETEKEIVEGIHGADST